MTAVACCRRRAAHTGKYRFGKDPFPLLVAADGKSWFSKEDFAVAMVDGLEQPQHARQRLTVGD